MLKDALRNRLTVTLDVKIAQLKQAYKNGQDKMVDRRNILIEQAKDSQRDDLRPKFAALVTDMEAASIDVG